MVDQMDMNEKTAIVSGQNGSTNGCSGQFPGAPRLGFPGICLSDGPNGLHNTDTVNAYASGITIGATWNKELALKRGQDIGLEAKVKGINNMLGPTVGPLGRVVMGGRNWVCGSREILFFSLMNR